jgi:hypothetical protein
MKANTVTYQMWCEDVDVDVDCCKYTSPSNSEAFPPLKWRYMSVDIDVVYRSYGRCVIYLRVVCKDGRRTKSRDTDAGLDESTERPEDSE